MTYLMIIAGAVPWGFLLKPFGQNIQWVGIGVQIIGLIGVLFLGFTGKWGM